MKNDIDSQHTNGTFAFAPALQTCPSAKSKEPFFGRTHGLTLFLINICFKRKLKKQ